MQTTQFEYLDKLAARVAHGEDSVLGPLSTGEALYVILASNRPQLLEQRGDTVAEALARLGPDWVEALIERWRYKGNPVKWAVPETEGDR